MQVLVLGGGYAGLLVARKLERTLPDDASLTVVDETGDHLVQHELHRAIRRPKYADDIVIPLTELLERADVREARVEDVDREARTVALADGDVLDYDAAAVCLGAETEYYDIQGLSAHATPVKRLADAARVRRGFEAVVDAGGGTVLVGGAGLSGVQVAGELAAFARERGVDGETEVLLVEQEGTVAPGFPPKFQEAVRTQLDAQGVTVRTDSTVTGADADAITLDGEAHPYDQLVWTGGIRGPDALGGQRVPVRGDLRLDRHTVALGDAAAVVDADGQRVPASAQAAVRAADTAAHNLVETLEAERTGEFADYRQWSFESAGWLVSVGDSAVAQLGPEVFTGPMANLIKSSVGLTYLADHGSLRRALGIVREELDESGDVARMLKERL